MYNNITDRNNLISFGIRIKLSDKGLLNLPQKTDILYSPSPMDFFYKESKNKKRLDKILRGGVQCLRIKKIYE